MSEPQDQSTTTTSASAQQSAGTQPQQLLHHHLHHHHHPHPTPSSQPSQQRSLQDQTSPAAPGTTAAAAATQAQTASNHDGANLGRATSSEELVCLWQGCSEKCPTPETLYEHVCERHVGRKSTNNLNLTCQWGSCRTTTVKRDHITSHIRVHVPLKPHKCDFCGKAFKRPQDLKKHVKTHADDSVLVRSPEPGTRNQDVVFGVAGNPKGYAASHYFEPPINPQGQGYHHGAPPQYYPSQPQQPSSNPSYGNVYYTLNHGNESHPTTFESKKRGYEALNELFGDLKRRQFDPASYGAVGQRLVGLHGLHLPLTAGAVPEYQTMATAVSVGGAYSPSSLASPSYHLPPMGNARTKSDLVNIDQFLEQMQATVYESDDHIAAAGVAQPGATYVHGGLSYRATNSPPTQLPSSHATATSTAGPMMSTPSAHSPASTTLALTPPSSAQSYNSRSPVSFASGHRVSPPRQETGPTLYPRLPSTTMPENMTAAGYPNTSSAAPPSTLSGVFDPDDRRRYTGGMLQRARPAEPSSPEAMDLTSEQETPPAKPPAAPDRFSNSLIDPALHSGGSPDPDATRVALVATEAAERAEEQWVENVRLIENLRRYIGDRLARGDYENEEDQGATTPRTRSSANGDQMEGIKRPSSAKKHGAKKPPASAGESEGSRLYPVLKVVKDEDIDME